MKIEEIEMRAFYLQWIHDTMIKNDITRKELERVLGVNWKVARYICHGRLNKLDALPTYATKLAEYLTV